MSPTDMQARRRAQQSAQQPSDAELIMIRESAPPGRPLLRGVGLDQRRPAVPLGVTAKFPDRPDFGVLSESIPLFFITRNRVGLWVAREAEGRIGGIFLFKKSALRFAQRISAPRGCATMFLAEGFELDVENRGYRLIGWIGAALNVVARYIPEYPPPLPVTQKKRKGEWQ
jgi:hypothetical protein